MVWCTGVPLHELGERWGGAVEEEEEEEEERLYLH